MTHPAILELRAISEAGANSAMLACTEMIVEAKAGRSAAGILAARLRLELDRYPSGPRRDAFLEGFCDTLQRFIEAQGMSQPTISPALR